MESRMKKLTRNIFGIAALLVSLILIFSSFSLGGTTAPQNVSLNRVAQLIRAGEVKSLAVSGSEITVELSAGTKLLAQKEPDASFTETLKNYGVDSAALEKVELTITEPNGWDYWAGILIPTLIPVVLMIAVFWFMFRQAKSGANQAFSFGKANMKMFFSHKDKLTFKDVAGLKEAKEELIEVVDFLKNAKKFLEMGAKIPRGVLLMGQPGTGKTLLARAVAGEASVPFFHMSASEFVEMFVGVGASRVRDLFQTAKKAAPAIIFIDEIDAVGRERGAGVGGGHDEREQTLNQILVEMDGFERDTNIIVIAATNRPDILDQALLRPGRFDRRVVLDMPDISDREEILKIHAKGKPLDKSVDLKTVAVRTPGFSGADLANLMNEAAIWAARKGRKIVIQDDILDSIEKVMLGPARKSRVISDHEKKVTAYHEAGHALVAASLKDADPVHKVSIVSRGMAGGYTIKLPTEERRLRTKTQFLTDLAVAFGGFAAEKLIFGDVTTGSSSDIRQATDIAHNVITRYGMNEKLGPRSFGKVEEYVFLGHEIGTQKDYSEKTGAMIDGEVDGLIKRSLELAQKVLSTNRKILDSIAEALMKKETLEHEEFYKIVKGFKLKPVTITYS